MTLKLDKDTISAIVETFCSAHNISSDWPEIILSKQEL